MIAAPAIEELTIEQIAEGFSSTAAFPGYLRISLLENCNERCFFCHNEGYEGREQIIDEAVMWKAIEASLALGKRKFNFTGGEPTEHPDLVSYVARLRAQAPTAEIGMTTNATHLDRLAAPLRDAGMESVVVSLHSIDRDRYRKITQLDGLGAALRGLDALDKVGVTDVTINMVVSTVNIDEVPAMESFSRDRGYKLRLLDILPTHPGLHKVRVSNEELCSRFPHITVKPKLYHQKCIGCTAKPICGEGEYLRLSAAGTLDPCMYRQDLKLSLLPTDDPATAEKKVALGFRRIAYDTL